MFYNIQVLGHVRGDGHNSRRGAHNEHLFVLYRGQNKKDLSPKIFTFDLGVTNNFESDNNLRRRNGVLERREGK